MLPAEIVSCVVASAESVRMRRSTSTEFLIDTAMQSTGATTAVHETVSTASCFLTKLGFDPIKKVSCWRNHECLKAR